MTLSISEVSSGAEHGYDVPDKYLLKSAPLERCESETCRDGLGIACLNRSSRSSAPDSVAGVTDEYARGGGSDKDGEESVNREEEIHVDGVAEGV